MNLNRKGIFVKRDAQIRPRPMPFLRPFARSVRSVVAPPRLIDADDLAAFIVERNGFRYTANNLAICCYMDLRMGTPKAISTRSPLRAERGDSARGCSSTSRGWVETGLRITAPLALDSRNRRTASPFAS